MVALYGKLVNFDPNVFLQLQKGIGIGRYNKVRYHQERIIYWHSSLKDSVRCDKAGLREKYPIRISLLRKYFKKLIYRMYKKKK